jgi:sugar transferase (PEP-CTERM/EpsH1 system associated)
LKILWVKSGGLVPADHGGRIRSLNLLKELARHHEVDVFTFYASQTDDPHAELRQYFRRVVSVPLEIAPPKSAKDLLRYAANLFTRRPYSVAKYCRPKASRKLRELLSEQTYDVMICDFLVTAGLIPWDTPCPKVLFTHNVEAQIWQRHYQVAKNPVWKAVSWREYFMMDRFERFYLRRAEVVLAVSENDRAMFSRFINPSKLAVIQTGVDVDYFRPIADAEEPNSLVFTGSMDWLANEDGVAYFMREILPRIRQEAPGTNLAIVGRKPSARLRDLAAQMEGVHVTGTVEDIRPYIGKGSVYVVPLLVGGGTRIKIFEAMAMGKAVVSTSIGAEGLPVTHGKDILLTDKPDDFAREVVQLLKDPTRRVALGKAARLLVEKNYSWASVAKQLDQVLARVAAKDQ